MGNLDDMFERFFAVDAFGIKPDVEMPVGPQEPFLLLNPNTGPEQPEHLDRPLDPSEIEVKNVPWVGAIRYVNQVIKDAEKTRPVKLLPRRARCFTNRPRNKRNLES